MKEQDTKNHLIDKLPVQKLFMIIEQAAVDYRGSAKNLIDELLSIKQEMLEEERDLIKEAFYAGGQAYKKLKFERWFTEN